MTPGRTVGRYVLYDEIASGGMATVHVGRVIGTDEVVAIKRLHDGLANDVEFISMFLDEARLASRIVHPNVVPVREVVDVAGEILLVLDYVHGSSVAQLWRTAVSRGERLAPDVVVAIIVDTLRGLSAAHEARDTAGARLGLVHRDISPQNIMVGADGVARVIDFGIAKARGRLQTTRAGDVKGKVSYLSPEQLRGHEVDARSDLFAASVVLWELLTGQRLFATEAGSSPLVAILEATLAPPSEIRPELPPALDDVVLRGLARRPADRFESADAMAKALAETLPPAPPSRVAEVVSALAAKELGDRAASIDQMLVAGRTVSSARKRMAIVVVSIVSAAAIATVVVLLSISRGDPRTRSVAPALSSAEGRSTDLAPVPPAVPIGSAPLAVRDEPPPSPTASAKNRPPTRAPLRGTPDDRGCKPPFTVDADGIRSWKPWCR
jgi:eukaryotic-like serine/threonine-protein kinase